ncbi:MAG: hypothetical protein ABSG91_24750 [Syntrophobacteraceae bacterium]|jgi:hypothetical protein
MKYYQLEPEVAGGFGEHTVIDRASGKMVVRKLHYEFDGWLGDELLESTPCFIVSERLARQIERAQLTGISFDDVEVTKSDQFEELYPNRQIPKFIWLKIQGEAGRDDFGIAPGLMLVISERALEVLKGLGISNALVTPFEKRQ